MLSWLLVMTALGEVIWALATADIFGISFRIYSIWAVMHVAVSGLIIAALVDFLNRQTFLPARLLFVLGVVGFYGIAYHGEIIKDAVVDDDSGSHRAAPAAAEQQWLDHLAQRLKSTPPGPVVLVAASGGGSRAALFTALVLQMLKEQPMDFVVSDKPRYQAAAGRGTWADHILMISSVSGGSLATARFIDRPDAATQRHATNQFQYTDRNDLVMHAKCHIEAWQQAMTGQSSEPKKTDKATPPSELRQSESEQHELALNVLTKLSPDVIDNCAQRPDLRQVIAEHTAGSGVSSSRANARSAEPVEPVEPVEPRHQEQLENVAVNVFSSRYVDEMNIDFMAPILRGLLTPFASRGDGLFQFWVKQFGWQEHWRPQVGASPQLELDEGAVPHRPAPIALINTADARTGRRVMIGFPTVPRRWLDVSDTTEQRRSNQYAPRSLADHCDDPSPNLSLARAVRLSSNFPLGFPVAELSPESSPALRYNEFDEHGRKKSQPLLRLIDGGVVDNTGLDSLHAVFDGLRRRAEGNPEGREADLLEQIRKRGVVLVEIDAGAKPVSSPQPWLSHAVISEPLGALNNATYTNALRICDTLIDQTKLSTTRAPAPTDTLPPWLMLSLPPGAGLGQPTATPRLISRSSNLGAPVKFLHYPFVCNDITSNEAHVMTAFALGPKDKAAVFARFLLEANEWLRHANDREAAFYREEHEQIANQQVQQITLARNLVNQALEELREAGSQLQRLLEDWGRPAESDEENEQVRQLLEPSYLCLLAAQHLAQTDQAEEQSSDAVTLRNQIDELLDPIDGHWARLYQTALEGEPEPMAAPEDVAYSTPRSVSEPLDLAVDATPTAPLRSWRLPRNLSIDTVPIAPVPIPQINLQVDTMLRHERAGASKTASKQWAQQQQQAILETLTAMKQVQQAVASQPQASEHGSSITDFGKRALQRARLYQNVNSAP